MGIRPYAATYQRARRLMAVGCPIDDLSSLEGAPHSLRKHLYIAQLEGHRESCVIDLGHHHIGYVIALRVGTDLPRGAVIVDWSFSSPWRHHVDWDRDPRDVIPRALLPGYGKLVDSRLMGVLNERRLLTRGHPLEGVLCGIADLQSIPEDLKDGESAVAKFSLTDDCGLRLHVAIRLRIDRIPAGKTTQVQNRRIRRSPVFSS